MSMSGPDPARMSRGELAEALEEMQERMDDLEQEVRRLDGLTNALRQQNKHMKRVLAGSEERYDDFNVEENPPVLAQLQEATDGETLSDLRDDLRQEMVQRSRSDSEIRQRVNTVAEAADVDIDRAAMYDGDAIARLYAQGPDAVTDQVYTVHERAHDVLQNATQWGRSINDKHGARVELRANEVRESLELLRNESLQSKQVLDVFDKLVEIAEDSPRRVTMSKNDENITRLRIDMPQMED